MGETWNKQKGKTNKKFMVGPQSKTSLGRPHHRSENNNKCFLKNRDVDQLNKSALKNNHLPLDHHHQTVNI
jgi:hypothetical protein